MKFEQTILLQIILKKKIFWNGVTYLNINIQQQHRHHDS